MISKHQIIEQNLRGRDFFISDIHGHKRKFERALARVDFSAQNGDRLFCVGDLIDRGEDNLQILGKQQHWDYFYSIIGNHELMLMEQFNAQPLNYDIYSYGTTTNTHAMNGGKWFSKLKQSTRERVYQQIKALPVTMEVQTEFGRIGLVHAEVPLVYQAWSSFVEAVQSDPQVFDEAVWGREVIKTAWEFDKARQAYPADLTAPIQGVDVVLHGHTLVKKTKVIGNRLYIDTGLETGEHTILSAEEVFMQVRNAQSEASV